MIYDEIMQNLSEIIGTEKNSENVHKIFKNAEELFQKKEIIFEVNPRKAGLLNGMGFTKNESGDICVLIG
jgi:hypothetical protein